jgi:hypothetical protein
VSHAEQYLEEAARIIELTDREMIERIAAV